MEIIVKNIICIFTIKEDNVYIVVDNNKIPCITCNNEIDIINKEYLAKLNVVNLDLKQTYTFSEKCDNILTFYILFNDIVKYDSVKEYDLLLVNELDNNKFISKSMEYLKENIVKSDNLKKIFDGEFVLPKLQKIVEKVLDKKFDRRNFRKKLLNQNIIEPVDKTNNNDLGRPAKLYRFKNIEGKKIL